MTKNFLKKFLLTIITIFIVVILFTFYSIGNENFKSLKSFLSSEQKKIIKKYIFPYKLISQQDQTISRLKSSVPQISSFDVEFKESLKDTIVFKNIKIIDNDITLERYKLFGGFDAGIWKLYPGSGFIDFHQNNILIMSSRGVLVYSDNLTGENNLKQIENNINEFISLKQFKLETSYSLKDLFVYNDKIFVSYTEEIKENCWNTSVIYAEINYKKLIFKKLFSSKECIHQSKNIDKEFSANQSGGRIVDYDNDNILVTIGDYKSRYLAQDLESVNGKIIKLNLLNGDYKILSMGHRNPQGLYHDKENKFIISTEHGPKGGDEINLIEVDQVDKNLILNFGWPISSYGVHYVETPEKLKKYPLYKSHSEHGFIEPLKFFKNSIGISEVVKIGLNKYVVSSLKDRSLHFFDINDKKKITNTYKLKIGERIRDLKFKNNKLYLFLEDTGSVGIINL